MRSALGADAERLVRQVADGEPGAVGAGAVLGLALAFALVSYLAAARVIALPLLSRCGWTGQRWDGRC